MISVGGMNELRNGFPEMAKKHATRKQFIQSVLNVTKIMKLDGLDVDWEFPAWLGQDERQRIYFVQLLQELRKEFDRSGRKLLLSIAVAAPPDIVDQSYNVPQIAELVYSKLNFFFFCFLKYFTFPWLLRITEIKILQAFRHYWENRAFVSRIFFYLFFHHVFHSLWRI